MTFSKEADRDRRRFYLERQNLIESSEPEQVISLRPAAPEASELVTSENLVGQWMNNCVLQCCRGIRE